MAIPTLISVHPVSGPSSGNDLVQVAGSEFSENVFVLFGDASAEVLSVRTVAGVSLADIRTPGHSPDVVDITLSNLDAAGDPIPGEEAVLPGCYRFLRPRIVNESDLTRLVRALLRGLKRQVLKNTSITVSIDYDDTVADGLDIIAISQLPSLVLSGPRLSEDRFYSTNELLEEVVAGVSGPEIVRHRPSFTTDLMFVLTAASDRTTELLNLMAAVATFLNRNRWIEMPRDPEEPGGGSVRWEMDPEGDFRTRLDGPNDVRVCTCGFVVRGFDVDEGLPLDIGKQVDEMELATEDLGGTP
ncbi:MAG: transcription factor [Deltaproteobacteria bacterium]|nr:transcription factor [Deltaproteobacteria bacterium]